MDVRLISNDPINKWLGFETLRYLPISKYTTIHFLITKACKIYPSIYDVPFKELSEYDAVFLLGNPITNYKISHPTYRVGEVGICDNNAEVIHVACDWLDIPVISLNIYFDEPEFRTKPLPSRNIFTGVNAAIVSEVLDPIAKHLNLNQDSKVLIYLAEPIFISTSYEGKATKQIIKFLRNYK